MEVMREATQYFEVDPECIESIFTTEWNPSGIQPIDLDAGTSHDVNYLTLPVDDKHVDILLLTISRSLHLTGVCVGSQQLLKWHQNPKSLRKGIHPAQVKKLKVRVKKMSLVWKAEGYVELLCLISRYLLKYNLSESKRRVYRKAIKHFQNSLLVSPRDPVALRNMANLYQQLWFGLSKFSVDDSQQQSHLRFLDFLWSLLLEVCETTMTEITLVPGRPSRHTHVVLLCRIL
jgi:hypothetical protein